MSYISDSKTELLGVFCYFLDFWSKERFDPSKLF